MTCSANDAEELLLTDALGVKITDATIMRATTNSDPLYLFIVPEHV